MKYTAIVHFIVMPVVCNFVEITNVAKALHMMNALFVWR